jgi:hypothetical protein
MRPQIFNCLWYDEVVECFKSTISNNKKLTFTVTYTDSQEEQIIAARLVIRMVLADLHLLVVYFVAFGAYVVPPGTQVLQNDE